MNLYCRAGDGSANNFCYPRNFTDNAIVCPLLHIMQSTVSCDTCVCESGWCHTYGTCGMCVTALIIPPRDTNQEAL